MSFAKARQRKSSSVISLAIGCSGSALALQAIRAGFSTPEWINDHPHTAPSKRITQLFPAYDKPAHPLFAALDIGLDTIRQQCPLFDAWVKQLEALVTTAQQVIHESI